ncbi:hypothetical protein AB0F11_33350 [Streptomyces sp. NPDC032472]|uniref:hypothetical protein n=1 Tax=Streptomyces sp. NPDC032472 TaxID=3155018 RepID=UPI003405B700
MTAHEIAADVILAAGAGFAGPMTLSGLSMVSGAVLLFGLRGSDTIKIDNKKKATGWGITFSTLAVAAGSTFADAVQGVAEVPVTVAGAMSGGDPGLGCTAIGVTLCALGPRWKNLWWPALYGIAAGVIYTQAGGGWAVGQTIGLAIAQKIG